MQTSGAGRNFIKNEEGLRLTVYSDVGNPAIGYGHNIILPQESWMLNGITEAQADQILQSDLQRFEAAVNRCVTANVTQNQFDAMVSLAYNIGTGGFCGSTVAREINAGNCVAAANAFRSWRIADGRINQALVARRERERAIFIRDCNADNDQINDGYDTSTGNTPNRGAPQLPGNEEHAPAICPARPLEVFDEISGEGGGERKNAQRLGDVNEGGGAITTVAQTTVFVNGELWSVDGSTVTGPHTTTTANGNPKVFAEGKKVNRRGDRDANGYRRVGGSPNTFVN